MPASRGPKLPHAAFQIWKIFKILCKISFSLRIFLNFDWVSINIFVFLEY